MSEWFEAMEACARAAQSLDEISYQHLVACASSTDWRVRYAAVIALGERKSIAAINVLLSVLESEDRAPIYSQPGDLCSRPAGAPEDQASMLPPGTTEETASAWRRRGRLKQATCLALEAIGMPDSRVTEVLQRYATDQREDAMVRAAAGKTLGTIGGRESLSALAQAMQDEEWCSRTEATKAYKRISDKLAGERYE